MAELSNVTKMLEAITIGQKEMKTTLNETKQVVEDQAKRFGTMEESMSTMDSNIALMKEELDKLKNTVSQHDDIMNEMKSNPTPSMSVDQEYDPSKRRKFEATSSSSNEQKSSPTVPQHSQDIAQCRLFADGFPGNSTKKERVDFLIQYINDLGTSANIQGGFEVFCRGPKTGRDAVVQFKSPEIAKQFFIDNKEGLFACKFSKEGTAPGLEKTIYWKGAKSKSDNKRQNCARFLGKFIEQNNLLTGFEVDKNNGVISVQGFSIIRISCNKEGAIRYFVDKDNCIDCNIMGIQEVAEKIIKDFAPSFD
jgi:hypothetical protein